MGRGQDMVAALQRRTPKVAVPVWELEFHAWDAASGRHVVLGREFEALSSVGREKALHTNAEILLTVAEEMGWSALTVPGFHWEQAPGEPAHYYLPEEWRFHQVEVLRKNAPDDLLLIANATGVLSANHAEEFCLHMFGEPERIDCLARKILRGSLELLRRFRDLGVGAVFTASDIADYGGPFFTPAQMGRWIDPFLKRWAATAHELGLFSILHSDGNLTPCLDRLASSGVDAIHAIDPVAGMDMQTTKRQVAGRVCLCGNIDCGLLIDGLPEQVFESTRDLLVACMPGGGLVLGASNAVQAQVPMENYRAMVAAWRQFGRYRVERTRTEEMIPEFVLSHGNSKSQPLQAIP